MRFKIRTNERRRLLLSIPADRWVTVVDVGIRADDARQWTEAGLLESRPKKREGKHGARYEYRRIVAKIDTKEDADARAVLRKERAAAKREARPIVVATKEKAHIKPTIPGARVIRGKAQSGSPDSKYDRMAR